MNETAAVETESIDIAIYNKVATVTINRPSKRNALSGTMRTELRDRLREVTADPDVRAIVVTGAGGSFCAGGDVAVLHDLKARNDEAGFIQLLDDGRQIVESLQTCDKPTIAMVNGIAHGAGCLIAMACDLRFCAETASFALPFVRLGIGPDWGGLYFLPRMIGTAKALEMLYFGTAIGAEEAWRVGLCNSVYEGDELIRCTYMRAFTLAELPAEIHARNKQIIHGTQDSSYQETVRREREAQLANFRSAHSSEGIAAFLEKRKPDFQKPE